MHEDKGPDTPRVLQPEDTSVRYPWDRQEGEGERAWTAFVAYRDHTPRALHRTETYVGNIRVASGEISKWYREHKWEERCNAFDVLTDRIIQAQRRKALEEKVEDMASDQLLNLARLRMILSLELNKYLEAASASNGPGLIKPADLKGLMEAEIKMTRLIKGETTEEVGVQASPGLDKIDPKELMAWRDRLLGKKPKSDEEDEPSN